MSLKERFIQARARREQLDPGVILFINSLKRVQGIADRSLGVLRNPDGTPMGIPLLEPLGIVTELASLDAMHTVELQIRPERRSLYSRAVIESRNIAWLELLSEFPEDEVERLDNNLSNYEAYLGNAMEAAVKILNANTLRKREREMSLRVGLPPHLHIMRGIREGTLSY
ncbi:MAG: hypothetical protein ACHQT7_00955 [Candidatus Levyibacteriota bacterium]